MMISINVIIFSNYMFCEVYRSHPEDSGGDRISAGYPPSGVRVLGAVDIHIPPEGFMIEFQLAFGIYKQIDMKSLLYQRRHIGTGINAFSA